MSGRSLAPMPWGGFLGRRWRSPCERASRRSPPHVAVDDLTHDGETVVVHLPQHPVLQLVSCRRRVSSALEYAAEVGDRRRGQTQWLCWRDPPREGPDVPRRHLPQRLLVTVANLIQSHLGPGPRRHPELCLLHRSLVEDMRLDVGRTDDVDHAEGWFDAGSGQGCPLSPLDYAPMGEVRAKMVSKAYPGVLTPAGRLHSLA